MVPAQSPPDCVVHVPGAVGPGAECMVLDVSRREVTVSVETEYATQWKCGDPLTLQAAGQEPVPATIQSVHPNGQVAVVALKTKDATSLLPLAPQPMPASSNKRASFRTRVGPGAAVQVTVRPEGSAHAGKPARTITKGFPGFLLDASFDGVCVLVDRAAAAALPQACLVRIEIVTATAKFEVFGAIRHTGKIRQGARLGIETGSFPHALWPESQEHHLRDFVLEQQRAELQRRKSG